MARTPKDLTVGQAVRHQAVNVDEFTVDGVIVHLEFDGFGNHRLKVFTGQTQGNTLVSVTSPWVGYQRFSSVGFKDRNYVGVSDYWLGVFGAPVFLIVRGEKT